ncbi:MAG: fibronectin type III domain-containing protein [Ilumatobacteraceae bacterium]
MIDLARPARLPSGSAFRRLTVLAAAVLCAVPLAAADRVSAASAQLVANSSVETVTPRNSALPLSWTQAKSGKFRVAMSYPTGGARTGTRFVRTAITSYTSGYAGWRFAPVGVVPGQTYQLSTWYRANAATSLVAEFRTAAGAATFQQVATVAAAANWAEATATVVVPAGTATMTVVHRLSSLGTLDVDDTKLTGEVPGTGITAPASVSACATALNQLTVSWSAVSVASSYDLSYGLTGASPTVVTGITSTSRSVSSLAAGTYEVRVRAVSGTSSSPWSAAIGATAVASTSTSLVSNGSFELMGSGCAAPQSWIAGGWGTNTRTLTTPSTGGATGARFGRVQITSYSSGDAKWAFDHVPVSAGGTYVFSDWYRSSAPSQLTIEYRTSAGALSYAWLRDLAAATNWTPVTAWFTVPAGVTSASVFHLIARVGTLDIDDASIVADASTLAPPAGLAASSSAADRFTASWGSVAAATAYDLQYAGTSSTGTPIAAVTVADIATTSTSVTGLTPGWYSVQVRARNSTATSAWSSPAAVAVGVTGTPPIPGLPTRFVAGYLEGWNLALPSTLPSQYELLYHAFAPVQSDGSVTIYLSGVSRTALATEYKARRAAGKPTLLSIGGGGGAQAGLGTAAPQQAFLASVKPLIDEFGFSGIDWDLEAGVPGGISATGLAAISRALRVHYGAGFLITMAPYGDPTVETPMRAVARDLASTGDLAYVGFQFYNDNAPTSSSVLAKMRSWMTDTGIRPDQFVIGFWAGPWDWPAGYVMPETAMAAIYADVAAAYPTLRGTYTWGIRGTDMPRGWLYATTMWPVVHPA